jgi:hypothetical protein
MRNCRIPTLAGLLLAGTAFGQVAGPAPGVSLGPPVAATVVAPPVLPPAAALGPPPAPPDGFAVGLPPGTVVSPVAIRPPDPVTEAPVEVPPGPRFWGSFEYLLWRSKGGLVPPLVVGVTGPAALTVPVNPRAAFAVSDDRVNGELQSGFRIGGGVWLDKPHGTGVEASYMTFLESTDTDAFRGAPGSVLGRLFTDASRGLPALFQLSTPGGTTEGLARVRTSFDADGFEVNMLRRGPAMIGEEMHWILGVRYFGLEESLSVEGVSTTGTLRASAFDRFATRNNFYGAQVGGRWSWVRNDFSVTLMMKMALGGMGQEAVIHGASTVLLPTGERLDRAGGLLALSSNSGDFDRTKVVWLRDISVSIGYCLTENVTLRLGYDFLWLSNVVRPGEQIDLRVNPSLLPFALGAPSGPARPRFRFDGETFWMHGISVGVAVQF